jgi:hypothetical protein
MHLPRQPRVPLVAVRQHPGCHGRCFAGVIELRFTQRGPCCAKLMTHTYTELLRYVGVRWLRVQSSISGLYHRRVTVPVQLWLACGRPPQFRPRLPWWQPFVYRWLVITRWYR